MHPQILRTWPRGRRALAIRGHNLFQNNGKRILFSQNWSDNDAKKNGLRDFYDICICTCRKQDDQNWYFLSFFLSFFLYVLTSVEDIRRASVYKCKGGRGVVE